MGSISRRPEFKEDLFQIWSYIASDSVARADAFLAELEGKFRLLSDSPFIGVQKLPNFPRVHVFPYKSYLIVYEPSEQPGGVDLIRLLHGARDWRRLLEFD